MSITKEEFQIQADDKMSDADKKAKLEALEADKAKYQKLMDTIPQS